MTKKIAFWLAILIVLILLAAGGCFYKFQKDKIGKRSIATNEENKKKTTGQLNEQPAKEKEQEKTVIDQYIKPVMLQIDDKCVKGQNDEGGPCSSGCSLTCTSMAKADLGGGISVEILPIDDKLERVYLKFTKDGQDLGIAIKGLPSFISANTFWFGLDILYISSNDIFVDDFSGHESERVHYHYDGKEWTDFEPWDLVRQEYPPGLSTDRRTFDVSVTSDGKKLKLTELNYYCNKCGEATEGYYGLMGSETYQYRKIFIIDRATNKIISTEKINRFDN